MDQSRPSCHGARLADLPISRRLTLEESPLKMAVTDTPSPTGTTATHISGFHAWSLHISARFAREDARQHATIEDTTKDAMMSTMLEPHDATKPS